MKIARLLSAYRWPIYIGAHLVMSVTACAVLVWFATRPDAPRPIPDYYQAAQAWDVTEAVESASRELGWRVHLAVPRDVPSFPGMPRAVDVVVEDRGGRPVSGLVGHLLAVRPADEDHPQRGELVELPQQPGSYRTLVRLDQSGAWDVRVEARQQTLRFVHADRLSVPPFTAPSGGAAQ